MMRILFLILLLANIVAFLLFWNANSVPQSQDVPIPVQATQPLQLLSELTPKERAELAHGTTQTPVSVPAPVPAATTGSTAAVATLTCASYGPFPGEDAAKSGTERLQKAGVQVTQRLVPGKVKLGYWVYLPPFSTRKEAESAQKLLKKRGIKDMYIVADEANRNAISLGVYSQRSGAVERRKQIRKLGFHPQLSDRFRDTPNYWLDAQGSADQLPDAKTFSDLAEGDAGIARSEGACPGGGN